jgi:ferrous iron transport protein A
MSLSLGELAVGQSGVICGFKFEDDHTNRLMQMGLIEGTAIKIIRVAPSGDPIEVHVAGYALSMRKTDADAVMIEL